MTSDGHAQESPADGLGEVEGEAPGLVGDDSRSQIETADADNIIKAMHRASLFPCTITVVDCVSFIFVLLTYSYVLTVLSCEQMESRTNYWIEKADTVGLWQQNDLYFVLYWAFDIVWRIGLGSAKLQLAPATRKAALVVEICIALYFSKLCLLPLVTKLSEYAKELGPSLPTDLVNFTYCVALVITSAALIAPGIIWLFLTCTKALPSRLLKGQALNKPDASEWNLLWVAATMFMIVWVVCLNQWLKGHCYAPLLIFVLGLLSVSVRTWICRSNQNSGDLKLDAK